MFRHPFLFWRGLGLPLENLPRQKLSKPPLHRCFPGFSRILSLFHSNSDLLTPNLANQIPNSSYQQSLLRQPSKQWLPRGAKIILQEVRQNWETVLQQLKIHHLGSCPGQRRSGHPSKEQSSMANTKARSASDRKRRRNNERLVITAIRILSPTGFCFNNPMERINLRYQLRQRRMHPDCQMTVLKYVWLSIDYLQKQTLQRTRRQYNQMLHQTWILRILA